MISAVRKTKATYAFAHRSQANNRGLLAAQSLQRREAKKSEEAKKRRSEEAQAT